jgi:hypothetical protein
MRFSTQTPPPITELPTARSELPEKTLWGFINYLVKGDDSIPSIGNEPVSPSLVVTTESKSNEVDEIIGAHIPENPSAAPLVDTPASPKSDSSVSVTSSMLADERIAEFSITTHEALSDTLSSTGAIAPASESNASTGTHEESERPLVAVDLCRAHESPVSLDECNKSFEKSGVSPSTDEIGKSIREPDITDSMIVVNSLKSPEAKAIEVRNSRELFSSAFSALSFPESVESSEMQSEVSQTVNHDEDFNEVERPVDSGHREFVAENARCVVCGRRGISVHMSRNRCVSI